MIASGDVQRIVQDIFRERFPKIDVLSVNVRMDDEDEGKIDIKVVLELPRNFNPADLSIVPQKTIERLTAVNETAFPVMSFIAKSDLGGLTPEAV